MLAIQIGRTGGPDALEAVEVPAPEPRDGEILICQEAVGLNFIDIYHRTGLYPVKLPAVLGSEGAGVVEAVGASVTRFKVGDRAAYVGNGAYAEKAVVAADRAVKLPDGVTTRIAAAAMLKGMTAQFLTRIWPLQAGDSVLVHAAAGGVGGILVQWLHHLDVRVIACVGTPEKAEVARRHGADQTILYKDEDVAKAVRGMTGGQGVKVAYDSVGKATFEASLKSLAKRGLLVSYGNASGAVPAFEPARLAQAGSLFLTRPTLFDYIATTEALDAAAGGLFQMIATGAVKIDIGQEWPLSDARKAHEALERRETTGASVLIP